MATTVQSSPVKQCSADKRERGGQTTEQALVSHASLTTFVTILMPFKLL